ncbi:hypothetical protein GOE08_06615 [Sinorhizobium medicae]|nr:hypothetical protein [Sinorhizobium medicae]
MSNDNRHTPRPLKLESMVQAIDDWIAKDRKLISAHEQLKRRVIREMTRATAMRRIEAENLFEALMQDRQARAGLIDKSVGVLTREYVYQDRAKCVQKYRAMYAHWWLEIGQHPPQPVYSPARDARSAPDFPTSGTEADRQCRPSEFLAEGKPKRIVALRKRDDEPK